MEKEKLFINNGNNYFGNLKGSKRDGKGKMIYEKSENEDPEDIGEYEGHWVRDQRYGQGIMKFENGNSFEGIWKNGRILFYF